MKTLCTCSCASTRPSSAHSITMPSSTRSIPAVDQPVQQPSRPAQAGRLLPNAGDGSSMFSRYPQSPEWFFSVGDYPALFSTKTLQLMDKHRTKEPLVESGRSTRVCGYDPG